MKSLGYYFFGIVSAIYAFTILFNLYADVYLDDYYVELIFNTYAKEFHYTCITIASITIFCAIIWIYNLRKGTNNEKREPLLIDKEKENE